MLRQGDLIYGRQRGFNGNIILRSALYAQLVPDTQIICKSPFFGRDPALPEFPVPSPPRVSHFGWSLSEECARAMVVVGDNRLTERSHILCSSTLDLT